MPIKKELIYRVLYDLYSRSGRPVTVADIHRELIQMGYNVSERWIRKVLENYVRKGYADKTSGKPAYYKPRRRPISVITLDEFLGRMETSEEVSGKVELKEADYTEQVAMYILKRLKEQPRLLRIIEEHATEIADRNPIEEIIKLVDFLCKCTYSSDIVKDEQRYWKIIRKIERITRRWLGSVLGIPITDLNPRILGKYSPDILCGKAGEEILGKIAAIGIGIRSGIGVSGPTAIFAYNKERLKYYLMMRIVDDKVVVETDVCKPEEFIYISGHDTSYWPVIIRLPEGGVPASTRLYILSGIRYSTWFVSRGMQIRYVAEIAPHPSSLAYYNRRDAIEQGFLITQDVIEESEEKESRLVEASMNILEYQIIINTITGFTLGRTLKIGGPDVEGVGNPIPPPRPIFHDGRLFPYEHKLGDYVGGYGDWHSRLVRLSISKFRDIVRHVVGDEDLRIVGVVKRGRAPTIHPLIIWILRDLKAFNNDDEFWTLITRWLYERFEVTYLFKGVLKKRKLPSNKTLRTVGVIRRYWAMDDEFMRAYTDKEFGGKSLFDEYDERFWLEKPVFCREQMREDEEKGLRGYLQLRGIEGNADKTLAYVLANASIALTYVLPPRENFNIELDNDAIEFAMPRYEVLVRPLPIAVRNKGLLMNLTEESSSNVENIISEYRKYVREVLKELAIPRIPRKGPEPVLFKYDIAEVYENLGDDTWNIFMPIPLHIKRADEFAKRYDEELRELYKNELFKALKQISIQDRYRQQPNP